MENIYHQDYKKKIPQKPKSESSKCYTCKPRGTLKEHIISQTENFVFNHDIFRRPLIVITSIIHYHTIYELPDNLKLKLFEDVEFFKKYGDMRTYMRKSDLVTDSEFGHPPPKYAKWCADEIYIYLKENYGKTNSN